MDKTEAKKFIKESGFLIKNITISDETIYSKREYEAKYKKYKGGSISDVGYVIFMDDNYSKDVTGTLYGFTEKAQFETLYNLEKTLNRPNPITLTEEEKERFKEFIDENR